MLDYDQVAFSLRSEVVHLNFTDNDASHDPIHAFIDAKLQARPRWAPKSSLEPQPPPPPKLQLWLLLWRDHRTNKAMALPQVVGQSLTFTR